MAGNKVNTTLSFDKDLKKEFKLECIRNDNEMSTVLELLMKNYIQASRKMHSEND